MSNYDDIINLPHHQSSKRPHMSLHDRAAQFAPFAALKGYDDAVMETARHTDERIVLDENEIEQIDAKLQYLADNIDEKINITITYFEPDKRKLGGAYVTHTGHIIDVNYILSMIMFDDKTIVDVEDIIALEIND